ncbi:arsenosugar biosynthesis radical SAM protein ArsS [soil metagenome]
MKSLKGQHSNFSNSQYQLEVLEENETYSFKDKLESIGLFPLKSTRIEIFQMNVGKMCNQVCKHCHVDAGPDRREIMTWETMEFCLNALKSSTIETVDITGGAPEMNPHFRWLVEEISKLGKKIMVRCNLTIILANPKYHDLPEFFKKHQIEVVSSLPFYTATRTDNQRGGGVFERSVKALKMLNEVGYGKAGSNLWLNLVYNPAGAFLPADQEALERDFKKELKKKFNIDFNQLYAITNLPISRFLDYLVKSGNYENYMEKLVNAFNPSAAHNVMCRNTISIGWDGYLYDCDFNQMLDLKVQEHLPQHIKDFDVEALNNREIVINQHCFGCTAGAGSSCGGAVT